MKYKENISYNSCTYSCDVEEPSVCPICKKPMKPVKLGLNSFKDETGNNFAVATYLCRACFNSFIVQHSLKLNGNVLNSTVMFIEPNRFKPEIFEPRILAVSPSFEKIYNQALAAETYSLNEIAGIGYRKAVEFLIKDYLIHKFPDEEETIRAKHLGKCISENIAVENIKTVASRCAWIGNDFAHYTRKFQDKDIDDLKLLIEATVYWINIELITEGALAVERQDR